MFCWKVKNVETRNFLLVKNIGKTEYRPENLRYKRPPFFELWVVEFAISRSSRREVFCKKDVLRNFAKFTEKHLCQSLFFNKVADLRPATLCKERLWRRCFSVNFAKFLRTPFPTERTWSIHQIPFKVHDANSLLPKRQWRHLLCCT